jgi:hypothetical protein
MPPPSAGWWRFDEGSGPFSADASGNGHPANLVNSPLWKPGITGSAIELDGSSQFANLSPGPIIGSIPNFTIEAWVNWPGASGTQMIYCESAFTDVIDLYLENGVPGFSIVSGGSQPVTGTSSVTTSKWHQVAAVLQPGIGASLYLDGQILRTNPMVGPAAPNAFETNIGRSGASGGSRYFRGIIDEVRVFNSARSPGEIANDYKSYITGGP